MVLGEQYPNLIEPTPLAYTTLGLERMSYFLLYLKKRVESAAFHEALAALLARGFHLSEEPVRNRDGVAVRLQKEEEGVWLEWMDDDTLSVSATAEPSERLKAEISQTLDSANLKEMRIV